VKSKEQKEREKKEAKDAEKANKAAEKERLKAEEKKRKEEEAKRKENARLHVEEMKRQEAETKRIIAESKLTAAADEEKRKRDLSATSSETGIQNGQADKVKPFTSLGRSHKGSKSMSRKSFGFLSGKNANGEGRSSIANDETAVDGENGPQTPEKHTKTAKDRFSFSGIGRKKSNLNSS
jgi:ubiquitin carboxyl-terminal hydrolase 9/13